MDGAPDGAARLSALAIVGAQERVGSAGMAKRKRSGGPVGDTLGGIIVGFDQQILRNLPPPQELVQKGSPVRGLSGEDGTEFVVVFPGDDPGPPAAPEAPPTVAGEEDRG